MISDNGASAEGGPHGSVNENKFFNNVPDDLQQNLDALDDLGGPKYFNHYPWGWTFAGNTPFRRWKRETYRGGVSDPFLVHWPKGIEAKGEIRRQYAHAIDMVPTVLESLGIEAPTELRGVAQSPIEGVSFAHSFDDASAPTKHHTQYFEMFAHRSIYHDGWRAVCPFPGTSFAEAGVSFGMLELTEDKLRELDATGWELYNVEADPAETTDLAEQERAKLIEMIALWYTEAGKYNVLPLDSRGTMRFADERPQIASARDTYVYFPGTQAVPENVAAKVLNRAHTITVDAELSEGDEGVLACHGSNVGGYVLFVQDGKLHYVHNYVGAEELRVSSNQPVPPGKHALSYEFAPTGPPDLKNGKGTPGVAKLLVDGEPVGQTDFPVTVPLALGLGSGFAVGRNPGSPVSVMYTSPFPFTGAITKVTVDVSGNADHDEDEVQSSHRPESPWRGSRFTSTRFEEGTTMAKSAKTATSAKAAKKAAKAAKPAKKATVKKPAIAETAPHLAREQLPIPDPKHVGLTTYDAKDPNTKYPPIKELRPPKRRTQCVDRAHRRCGIRRLVGIRRAVQYTGGRAAGGEWSEAQPVSHDRSVFTYPAGPADRAQPPLRGDGRDHRDGHIGAGQQQHPAQGEGADRGNIEAQRVLDRTVRQVPRGSGMGGHPRGPVPPVAHRVGFRALLRVHRRRGQPVLPRALRGHHCGRAAEITRGGLHPHRGSRRPRDHLGAPAEGADAGQAVLHVLRARGHPRPTPRAHRSGRTSTRASSTTAGMRCGRGHSSSRRSWAWCRRTRN